ncbi:hypothetical protein [Enterococcus wangshanyuanii]|uniref:Uncharacterized protein n=1 Tax=Enterococcus wangshanyuanii TaxID=2005703 RepID=A0ABQ1PSY9_9ENTE|nr:hypothetical protein [Enterococcus wangshanyuanii]GGD02807.1 hypothetical protein GCM10011573_35370 [Enterococcus wangshanyuanii]
MISIEMTEEEAAYLYGLLKNKTIEAQAIERKNQELAGFFKENNKMNGNLCRKITKSLKKDRS